MEEILQLLPHRYPFLLIDRVLSYSEANTLRAVKNISFNEIYCQGHFPKKPIFPGVLILEAIAQAAVILLKKAFDDRIMKFIIYPPLIKLYLNGSFYQAIN